VPLRLFRSRGLSTATGALALNGAAFLAMFFLTAIFLQQVRGLSALRTGVEFLPMGVAAIVAAVGVSQLVARAGTRPVHLGGAALSVIGLLLPSRTGADSSYLTGVLPGLLLFRSGIMGVAVPSQIAAVADVRNHEAGAASGVVTAGYQVGGALGLAIITTFSTARVNDLLAHGTPAQDALVAGFHRGLLVAAAFAALNVLVALGSPQLVPDAEQLAEAVAVG
jgi:predicted MFS family arabinose efflux permease